MHREEVAIHRLRPAEVASLDKLFGLFEAVFREGADAVAPPPDSAHLAALLASETFVAMVATTPGEIVGRLAAHVLPLCRHPGRELFVYDLAVHAQYRRQGVATALIRTLPGMGPALGAHTLFVQADCGNLAARRLYARFASPAAVLHYTMATGGRAPRA